jgi:hypothetical protein
MHQSFIESLLPWHDFYMLTGEAAATLIGLMFVALSLGIGLRDGKREDVNTFVTPTVVYFLGVVVITAISVMPLERGTTLGGLIAAIPLISTPVGVRRLRRLKVRHHASPIANRNWLWQWAVPAGAQSLLLVAGIGFIVGDPRAHFVLAGSIVALLVAGVRNAWTFMIWIVEKLGQ